MTVWNKTWVGEFVVDVRKGRDALSASSEFFNLILNPAVEIATESQSTQSKWKRGPFPDALSSPRG